MNGPSIFDLLGDMLARLRYSKKDKPVLTLSLLAGKSLHAVFQPIVELKSGAIVGHEALIRAPAGLSHLSAINMLRTAEFERCLKNFELTCLEQAAEAWVQSRSRGKLFVNLSAQTLVQLHQADRVNALLERMRRHGVPARNLGVDLTDCARMRDLSALVAALRPLRTAGVELGLDDFRASGSALLIWAKLLPGIVKLAPRWTFNIATDGEKADALARLVSLTRKHGGLLVAKGVETAEELRALQKLGVQWGQGYFLGCPDSIPITQLNHRAHAVLCPPVLNEPASNEARAVSVPAAIQRWWDSRC